jgi:hypothetical protein
MGVDLTVSEDFVPAAAFVTAAEAPPDRRSIPSMFRAERVSPLRVEATSGCGLKDAAYPGHARPVCRRIAHARADRSRRSARKAGAMVADRPDRTPPGVDERASTAVGDGACGSVFSPDEDTPQLT